MRRALPLTLLFLACPAAHRDPGGEGGSGGSSAEPPRFVSTPYVDPEDIAAVSRFRSGVGHDYHDDFESCRSMKHYFKPKDGGDWSGLVVRSPVAGTITRRMDEWAGAQLWIRADSHPSVELRIFHITLARELHEGDRVAEGEVLGHHVGDQTYSDVAVALYEGSHMRLVSYFDVLTDAAFARFQARGVADRSAFVISRAERDADPLPCDGETIGEGTLPNWVELTP